MKSKAEEIQAGNKRGEGKGEMEGCWVEEQQKLWAKSQKNNLQLWMNELSQSKI